MSKPRKGPNRRDAPAQSYQTAWLCSPDAYKVLCGDGYRRLTDCPEVQMCVNVYAEMISTMTLHLMQNTAMGDVRVKNALSRKLDIEPNKLMNRKTWMYNLVKTLMLTGEGNQVTYPLYDANGYLDDLIPLKPSAVSFADTQDGSYRIRYGDKMFSPDEVLHFVLNPDPERPYIGTGYQVYLRDVVKGLRQAGATKQALLESPSPSLIVKVDGLTDEFSNKSGREKLLAQYIDADNNGKPWLIPAEAFSVEQVKPLTLNDLAIKTNIELDKRTVAGIFGTPPYMVGVGSYNKAEHNDFINTRVMPVAKTIEQEFTRKLLISPDLYWRFNPRSLYAYDLTEIINAGSAMVDRMAMRRNEWRDWIGMSPDDEMKELLALENFIPANKLGEQKKLTGGGE